MTKERIKKIFRYLFIGFVALLVAFYFLAGDQIRYRDSRKNINVTNPNTTEHELSSGTVYEQKFINLIDRLYSVSFICTTNYRSNIGTITIELLKDDKLLASTQCKASEVQDGIPISLQLEKPITGLTGQELTIRIYSNSVLGHSVTPLINTNSTSGTSLVINSYYSAGSLCFSVTGQEYIFTGQVYWWVVLSLSIIFGFVLLVSYKKYSKGKNSYIVGVILAVYRYSFLISQLVARDFKSKYKRSLLGVFWSFLNPLLTMVVQFIVFSTFFRSNISNYPVYLLSGVICYSFFQECTSMCLTSISSNARLITKVYIPKYIFPFSRTLSSGVNLAITLVPLLLVSLVTGLILHKSVILILFFLVCLVVFALGVGMILSTLMVFFRDIQFLWTVLSMIWMYATPIFYPASIIPERFNFILRYNPLYHFIKNVRLCLIDGISPEPRAYAYCFLFALVSLLIGSFVFKKNQDKFTLYL